MKNNPEHPNVPIAIIGMGCIFPKSSNLKDYWRLILNGEDAIMDVPPTHWSAADYFHSDPKHPDHVYCTRGGFIPEISFDPSEFGIPPTTLEATDTSQLLGLVTAKAALEDAGYGMDRDFDRRRTSVVLGVTGTQELVIPLSSRLGFPKWRKALIESGISNQKADEIIGKISEAYVPWQEGSFPGLLGNVVAGRICNRLDLGGTNCVVDAACASSMGAIHVAMLELISGRSDMVLSGGVDLLNDIFMYMCFSKSLILSPTGDAKPFSKDADGTVIGEGIGMVVLKRLKDAERDKDRIYAVIKGLGTSSDGKSQSIYAPRVEGQEKALRAAYENADIDPSTVQLVEAHGTGTRVGDKVEVSALKNVFSVNGNASNPGFCAIGSVKSMIGHTKAAAGAAGLIKTALALYHKVIPPTIKADEPDPALELDKSPFHVNGQARPWFSDKTFPRRAGVSAFGFGGANFHAVLEEYQPEKTDITWDGAIEIASFSGNSISELEEKIDAFEKKVRSDTSFETTPRVIAETRRLFSNKAPHRLLFSMTHHQFSGDNILSIIARSKKALRKQMESGEWNEKDIFYGGPKNAGKIAFVFPGQGSQYPGMGTDLINRFPKALAAVNRVGEFMDDLLKMIFPPRLTDKNERKAGEKALRETKFAQPAIGAVSMAMSEILTGFGVYPDIVCGHSYGELTALWSAGWIEKDDFFRLSVKRGELMAGAHHGNGSERGAMMAVKAPVGDVETLIRKTREQGNESIVLANRNSPLQSVVSGLSGSLEKFRELCIDKGFGTIPLPVSGAFHSPLMESVRGPFLNVLKNIRISPSTVQVFSNTTANAYPEDPEKIRNLLSRQLIEPVNFMGQIENMVAEGVRTFIEIGPKGILTKLIHSIVGNIRGTFYAYAMDGTSLPNSGLSDLAGLLCRLASLGFSVDLTKWESPSPIPKLKRMRIPLSGANFRSDKKKQPPKKSGKTETDKKESMQTQVEKPGKSKRIPSKKREEKPIIRKTEKMNIRNKKTPLVENTLHVLREGLKSMENLQMKTAEVHQKFLETQAEAGRTLRDMMKSLTGSSFDGNQVTWGPDPVSSNKSPGIDEVNKRPDMVIEIEPSTPKQPVISKEFAKNASRPGGSSVFPSESREKTSHVAPMSEDENTSYQNPRSGNDTHRNLVENSLIRAVSDLTGYPVDMISLSMDIESDLGIDSIKRVEILSAMEEQMEDLPPISPETVGSLKTLKDIANHIVELSGFTPVESPSPADTASVTMPPMETGQKTSIPSNASARIEKHLIEAVSELTGYPDHMLSLSMDIEADLGIDSIKRVEILSAMEEKMPDLPAVSPENIGTLKTLGDILQYLTTQVTPGKEVTKDLEPELPEQPKSGTSGVNVESVLLEAISELTGYPVDMLNMDMDIESDLGIDSIKRVEILSAVEENIPDLPPVSPEIAGTLKTLGQLRDFLLENSGFESKNREKTQFEENRQENNVKEAEKEPPIPLTRKTLALVEASFEKEAKISISPDRSIIVFGNPNGFAKEIAEEFQAMGFSNTRILDRPDSIRKVSNPGGVVIVADAGCDASFLKNAFTLARETAPQLIESATCGGAFFCTLTFMDGGFGLVAPEWIDPIAGGLSGLAKTAAIEWPDVCCHAIDIDPKTRPAAKNIVRKMLCGGPVEIGMHHGKVSTIGLVSETFHPGEIDVSPHDVVVVTGGARGVTAECASVLAKESAPRIVIIGRSPEPFPEPVWLEGTADALSVKKAIIANEFAGASVSPVQVEKRFKTYMANREIAENIAKMRSAGSTVAYYSADVRDRDRISEIFSEIRSSYGPIKGIVHGAGVLDDRRIADKTNEQFSRVFDTKVEGLDAILDASKNDPLKYLVLFSSVAARFGNQGQVDYAMANEVLNKYARKYAYTHPDCSVVSVNWGPWDGGMVSGSLRRAFKKRGIDLLPIASGTRSFLDILKEGRTCPVEIVIGAGMGQDEIPLTKPVISKPLEKEEQVEEEPLSLIITRELDVKKYPVLSDHVLEGKAVVPFALIAEWLGHGALHENPGLFLHGLDDMRVLKGIRLDEGKKTIRLAAGKVKRIGPFYEVRVEIRDGFQHGAEVIHSSAKAILTDKLSEPPKLDFPVDLGARTYARNIRDVYEKILFHGTRLHGIKEILSCEQGYMVAHVGTAPSPDKWMEDPLRSRWIADPLVLDSAFQMGSVWCYEQKGMVSLPSFSHSFRQYTDKFPDGGLTAVMEVKDSTDRKLKADLFFLNGNNSVVATITGYEAIMDRSLFSAFRENRLAG